MEGMQIVFEQQKVTNNEKRIPQVSEAEFTKCVRHVLSAKAQRSHLKKCKAESMEHLKNNMPHDKRHYTFICDYSQNMSYPHLGAEQAGETYYFTPSSVYCFGMVDCAHLYKGMNGVEDGDHMYAHVYEEAMGSKGGNNVASLILKTLGKLGLLIKEKMGGKLSIFFDNCVGQNKNNIVLLLVPMLVECGYFSQVEFVFLVVGHTKNACDKMFNDLKNKMSKLQVWTYKQLLRAANCHHKVTIIPTKSDDFFDISAYESIYYRHMDGMILSNHIFCCSTVDVTPCPQGGKQMPKVNVQIREVDLDDAKDVPYLASKRGRPKTAPGLIFPLNLTPDLTPLPKQEKNPYMVVHMFKKWRHVVPEQYWEDTCPEPTKEQFASVQKEGKVRKEVKNWKQQQKKNITAKVEFALFGEHGGGKMSTAEAEVAKTEDAAAVEHAEM